MSRVTISTGVVCLFIYVLAVGRSLVKVRIKVFSLSAGVCGLNIGVLLRMLSPHLLRPQMRVVHRTGAVRSLDRCLLVVHCRIRGSVLAVRIRVRVVVMVAVRHGMVWCLPAHRAAHVWAVAAAAVLVLAVDRRRLQDLRRIIT